MVCQNATRIPSLFHFLTELFTIFFFDGLHVQLFDDLQTDQWPVEAGNRSIRCTGVALSVAAGLLGACMPGTGARIIALLGGPCTEGPGMVNLPPQCCIRDDNI